MLDFSDMQGFSFRGGSTQKPKTRMAGDYMADFTKSNSTADTPDTPVVNNINSTKNNLINSFYTNYGDFNNSSQGNQSSTSTSSETSPSPASPSSSGTGYNGLPSVQERVERYYNSLEGDSKANFKTLDRGGGSTNETFYQDVYQQDEDLIKWADSYTGPKTWAEVEAAEQNTGNGKADNANSISNYNNYTKYMKAVETKKSIMDNWNQE